ncbi:MAG: ABC transporter substrate-binding protein [Vicinamibacterales bacterium]
MLWFKLIYTLVLTMAVALPSAGCAPDGSAPLTIAGSALGAEGRLLQRQLARFAEAHPGHAVELQATPDAADERHQLYVQWLNAHVPQPDVLQLDIIWTAEFAAAGWILPLDRLEADVDAFFDAAIAANRWDGRLYALPWFVDVGTLYWRTDLLEAPPASLDALRSQVARARDEHALRYGLVWQGARYEGLVTVFAEYLGAFGGRIMDGNGRIVVDSPRAVEALRQMRDDVRGPNPIVPAAALAWREEQSRFAFQNGDAVVMRNWPYAAPLLRDDPGSRVVGRFAIAAMPAAAGGSPTATLGGSQLAINARSQQPELALALIAFLTAPEQMLERALTVGQYPARPALFDAPELRSAFAVPPEDARRVIERAVPRPVTPVYAELSELLQVGLHEVLTGQREPQPALDEAARAMRRVLDRSGLSPAGDAAR